MSLFERLMMGMIFAAAPAIALFNAGWHLADRIFDGEYIVIGALTGLFIGILIDLIFFRKILINAYNSGYVIPIFVYMFYMVCAFLCFNRLPVTALIIGIMAGFYEGRKLFYYKANSYESEYRIERTAQLTLAGIAVYCIGSTYFIFSEYEQVLSDINNLLHLDKTFIKEWMMLVFVIIFSIILIIFQYWITKKTAIYALRKEFKK